MARVSIGMPVYNGARYLDGSLKALLAQDFVDFELIISDNASTDGTEALCRAVRDSRVRYVRQPRNLGAIANFNEVFRLAAAPLFMWAAHDDGWEPSYVRKCVAALDAAPDAVLACSAVRFVDEDGAPGPAYADNYDTRGLDRRARVRTMFSQAGWFEMYGVIRADALRRTGLMRPAWGMDVVLTFELAMLGTFVRVPEPLFIYRVHRTRGAQAPYQIFDPSAGNVGRPAAFRGMMSEIFAIAPADVRGELLRTVAFRNPALRRMACFGAARELAGYLRRGRLADAARSLGLLAPLGAALLLDIRDWDAAVRQIRGKLA